MQRFRRGSDFDKRLAKAHGDATFQLTSNIGGINDIPEIVNCRVTSDLDGAGLRIDFNLAGMAAVGAASLFQCRLSLGVENAWIARRDVPNADRLIRTGS